MLRQYIVIENSRLKNTIPGHLAIRNLTRQTLTLKEVEQFDVTKRSASDKVGDKVESLASNFTTLIKDVAPGNNGSKEAPIKRTRTIYPKLDDNAKPEKKDDKNITVKPFKIHQTSIQIGATGRKNLKVLRLTFESDNGARYRTDVPPSSGESQTLKPLSPGPGNQQYTAIYNDDSGALAIFDISKLSKWMKAMPDHLPLSALSIPGTHNSPTYHNALPSVRCQAVSPAVQLENGVRFFDVRVQVEDPEKPGSDALHLVHSVFPISLTGSKYLRGLLDDIYAFLQRNPSETVILCLKREGRGDGTDAQLADRLRDHYFNPKQWHTESGIPNLGDARGKIVLMRRFRLSDRLKKEFQGKGWGIDATSWGDNTPNHQGGDVQIQDFYEVMDTENVGKKIQLVYEHFERAGAVSNSSVASIATNGHKRNPLYINFLSASNFWKPGCWPEKIAEKLNPAVTAFLCEKHDVKDEEEGDGCTGIVVCDWVGEDGDWDLVRAIVGMNSRVLMNHETRPEEMANVVEHHDEHVDDINGSSRGRGGGRGGRGAGRGRGRGGIEG